MATLITNQARAYINFGRWIADCPINCGSAMQLTSGQDVFQCAECRHLTTIEWPPNADALWSALEKRPAKKFRNWFPPNHELALRSNCPHGQTVAELEDETKEHEVS